MKLECGCDLILSAIPSKTLYYGQTKVKGYYCSTHQDYFPKRGVIGTGKEMKE